MLALALNGLMVFILHLAFMFVFESEAKKVFWNQLSYK